MPKRRPFEMRSRFRDSRGRFTTNDGRKKLTLEIWRGNSRLRVEETRRYKLPSIKDTVQKEHLTFRKKIDRESLAGRSLHETFTATRTLQRLSGSKLARVTVEFKDAAGQSLKFTKTVKLAVSGKNKAGQNRAILISSVLAEMGKYGVKLSPKKFRTGAEARTPTAKAPKITVESAEVVEGPPPQPKRKPKRKPAKRKRSKR